MLSLCIRRQASRNIEEMVIYTLTNHLQIYINSAEAKGMDATMTIKNSKELESYHYRNCVMTVQGNRDGYTDRQYYRTKRAWKLYINTRGGGFENFKHYLRQNLIKNIPVTTNNANMAEHIFVKDVGHLKGSTVRKTPGTIDNSCIEIP